MATLGKTGARPALAELESECGSWVIPCLAHLCFASERSSSLSAAYHALNRVENL
jgi:hypothetical protein